MYQKIKDIATVRELIRAEAKLEDVAKHLYNLDLRAAGQDDVKALCPFHKEDTPSFGIRKTKQFFHCFGCKESGDVFKFVELMDSCEHMEALRKIAEFIKFDLGPYKEAYSDADRKRQELYNINADVLEYGAQQRSSSVFVEWKKARRLDHEVLERYGVGYSPTSLEPEHVPSADQEQAVALGLDRAGQWSNVVVVPLRDAYGRVGGFCNRLLDRDAKIKVVGPDSDTYKLPVPQIYGLSEARKFIRQAGYLILVEGEVDVWQMVAHGYPNTAAMRGTKLNEEMLATLKELSIHKITVLADNDDAGRKFSRRLAESYHGDLLIKIATLSGDAKDPDEALLQYGADHIGASLADARFTFEYLIDRVCEPLDIAKHTAKLDALNDLRDYFRASSGIVRELSARRVAEVLGLDYEIVLDFYRESADGSGTQPLYNLQAERVVLKRMLLDEDFTGDGLLSLKASDFYLTKHRSVFEAIGKLYRRQEAVNEDTVRTLLENKTGEGAKLLVSGLVGDTIDTSSAKFMLDDMRDKSIRREIQTKARDAANKLGVGALDAREVVQTLSADISKAVVSSGMQISHVGEVVAQRMAMMHERIKAPNAIIGLDMGPDFPVLNHTLHGLQRKRYVVLSAPSKAGKTAFAGALSKRVAVDLNEPSLYFSFETGKEALTDRLISNISGVESDKIITGHLTTEEVGYVHEAAELIARSPLVITERGVNFEECVAILRHDVLKRGTRFVVVDYIQLMYMGGSDARLRRDQELGLISRGFLELAKELDITILVLAQQNREAVKSGSNEGTGIGESFKIFQDADVFIVFRQKTKEELEADGPDKGDRRMKLAGHRHGRGDVEINLISDFNVMRLFEYSANRRY